MPRVRLAARQIFELDPYLEVNIFERLLQGDELSAFLDDIDLVVEDCDDAATKICVREEARLRRIPLVRVCRGERDVLLSSFDRKSLLL